MDHLDGDQDGEATRRSNYPTVAALVDRVDGALDDQAARGQLIHLTEPQARARFLGLYGRTSPTVWTPRESSSTEQAESQCTSGHTSETRKERRQRQISQGSCLKKPRMG